MARFFLLSNQLQPGTSLLRHIYTHKLADLESLPLVFQPEDPKRGYDLSILVRPALQYLKRHGLLGYPQ
jgi:hypothetical protein